jgi:hypothetical protein
MDGRELEAYERFKEQAQHYRARTYDLEGELRVVEPQLYRAHQRIDRLEQRNQQLRQENTLLKQRRSVSNLPLCHRGVPPANPPSRPVGKRHRFNASDWSPYPSGNTSGDALLRSSSRNPGYAIRYFRPSL